MKSSEVRTILAITVIAWESLDSAIPKSCRTKVESLRTKLATMDSPEELLALISDAANNDVRLRLRTEIRGRIRKLPVRATVAK
jgi:hypothetical protein